MRRAEPLRKPSERDVLLRAGAEEGHSDVLIDAGDEEVNGCD